MPTPDDRRARRQWVAEHHPDRGGDPASFAAGLATFFEQNGVETPVEVVDHRMTVVRTAGPSRAAKRAWRRLLAARRRRTHHGSID